jgi:uncharacterized membrane protein
VFNSIHGISVCVCSVLWCLMTTYLQIDMVKYPVHLLWALHFLKNYRKEEVLRPIVGNPSHKTLRKNIWYMINKISELGNLVGSIYVIVY